MHMLILVLTQFLFFYVYLPGSHVQNRLHPKCLEKPEVDNSDIDVYYRYLGGGTKVHIYTWWSTCKAEIINSIVLGERCRISSHYDKVCDVPGIT